MPLLLSAREHDDAGTIDDAAGCKADMQHHISARGHAASTSSATALAACRRAAANIFTAVPSRCSLAACHHFEGRLGGARVAQSRARLVATDTTATIAVNMA